MIRLLEKIAGELTQTKVQLDGIDTDSIIMQFPYPSHDCSVTLKATLEQAAGRFRCHKCKAPVAGKN